MRGASRPSLDLVRLLAAVLAALAAAFTFAISAVLQQRSARELPDTESLHPRLVLDLVRRPTWVAGVAAMDLAYLFQVVALAFGPVAVVEPIVASELIFAVPIAVRHAGKRPGSREWLGMILCACGVSAFLFAAHPSGGGGSPSTLRWVLGFGPWAVVFALLVYRGRCRPNGTERAALLGAAAGSAFGFVSLVTKNGVQVLTAHGAVGVLTSWQPWVLLGVGGLGFLVGQSAYQAAPLASSLPLMDAVEPISAVLLSAYVLGERISLAAGALAVELVGAAATVTGIFLLGRSPLVLAIYESGEREKKAARAAEPSDAELPAVGSDPARRATPQRRSDHGTTDATSGQPSSSWEKSSPDIGRASR